MFVALVDATGIGLGALLLGLNLWVPIFIVVFLTSFIPLIGATVSGVVAVLVAVVEGGWVKARHHGGRHPDRPAGRGERALPVPLRQGHLRAPDRRFCSTVGVGGIVGGLVGALLAVPILSFTKAFIEGLRKIGAWPDDGDTHRERRAGDSP